MPVSVRRAARRSSRTRPGPVREVQVAPVQPKSMKERIDELRKRREQALHAGSKQAVETQHAKGKLTARERIDALLDPGSLGEVMAEKICKLQDLAVRMGVPCVGINDSGGARIQEGVVALSGYAEIF